jgi:hypothetical protein
MHPRLLGEGLSPKLCVTAALSEGEVEDPESLVDSVTALCENEICPRARRAGGHRLGLLPE